MLVEPISFPVVNEYHNMKMQRTIRKERKIRNFILLGK